MKLRVIGFLLTIVWLAGPAGGEVGREVPVGTVFSNQVSHIDEGDVEALYLKVLHRLPDEEGLLHHLDLARRKGKGREWLEEILRNSPEYKRLTQKRKSEMRLAYQKAAISSSCIFFTIFVIWFTEKFGAVKKFERLESKFKLPLAVVRKAASGIFRLRFYLAALVILVCFLFSIHGSSIEMWKHIVHEKLPEYSFRHLGEPRMIRSDEWLVSTPWAIAQVHADPSFPPVNRSINHRGMHMGVTTPNCPVWDITAVGQFHNWGYFLGGGSKGLSWNWTVRYIGIFILSMQFFLLLTGNNRLIGFAGAVAITFASPTQWWDTTVPFHLLYLFASVVVFYYFIHARCLASEFLCISALVVALSSFFFALYPPFQWPFFVLMNLIFATFYVYERRMVQFKGRKFLLAILGGVVCACVISVFWRTNLEAVSRVRNSVYPGERFFTGGDFSFLRFFNYPFVSLFFPYRSIAYQNVCAISMFLVPAPALLVAAPCIFLKSKSCLGKRVFMSLVLFGLMLLGWCLFQVPRRFAQYTFLFITHPHRAFVIVSFTFLLASLLAVYLLRRDRIHFPRSVAWTATVFAVAFLTHFAVYDQNFFQYYFPGGPSGKGFAMLFSSALVSGGVNFHLLRGRVRTFSATLAMYSLVAGLTIHPIGMGLAPLHDTYFAAGARRIHQSDPAVKWVVVGYRSSLVSQYLVANGLPVVTGVFNTPDLSFWALFDPEKEYNFIYNRYAHVSIVFENDNSGADGKFTNYSGDTVQLKLKPEELFLIPDVRYVVSMNLIGASGFELLKTLPNGAESIYIYRMNRL